MTELNVTSGISETVMTALPTSVIALIVLIFIFLILFLLFKYFRYFMYGLSIIIPLAIIGFITAKITTETVKGNNLPFYILGITFFTILVSTCIGKVMSRFKWFKRIENKLK